ncbi:hypothetical protein DPMN_036903 [Dreissena polymorpha]|uniref:Uncharacterized protein n=1 Tax=Dreissena polymorpha TaxID=45954 RepID=A0A9D4MCD1_DREPO|nr:hypothetical protein DPMN_036903 [Dreissena polymorpha]
MKKYEELLKLSQDPEKCDGLTDKQTDRQTDRRSTNHKSPPVLPVGDKNTNRLDVLPFSASSQNKS